MDDGAEPAGRVEGVVALDAVAGEDREKRAEKHVACRSGIPVAGRGGQERGRIEAGALPRELPIGVGEGAQRLVAGLADGGALKAEIGFAEPAERQRPAHVVEAVDMLVERGRADAEFFGEASEGYSFGALGVGQARRGGDDAFPGEVRPAALAIFTSCEANCNSCAVGADCVSASCGGRRLRHMNVGAAGVLPAGQGADGDLPCQ